MTFIQFSSFFVTRWYQLSQTDKTQEYCLSFNTLLLLLWFLYFFHKLFLLVFIQSPKVILFECGTWNIYRVDNKSKYSLGNSVSPSTKGSSPDRIIQFRLHLTFYLVSISNLTFSLLPDFFFFLWFLLCIYLHKNRKQFRVAWYWNLRNEMRCISKYLQEHYYNTVHHVTCALFWKTYQVLFSTRVIKQSNCNSNFWGKPTGQIGWLLLSSSLYHVSFLWFT